MTLGVIAEVGEQLRQLSSVKTPKTTTARRP
jgi:hypothetical protein